MCEADCSVRICDDEMATQYSSAGFIVLRELLPPGVIDEMSASVNKYIASRGPLLRAYDSGYLLPGIDRDPALCHLFQWVHRNPKVHAALHRIWHGSRGADHSGGGYQFIGRNEVSVDRPTNWHLDGFGWEVCATVSIHTR